MEILRKITIKTCGFDVTEIKSLLGDRKSIDLIKIVGVTSSYKVGQTDKGEFIKLAGTFNAINLNTAEMFSSSECLLPNFISGSIAEALKNSSEVEFALQIGVKADATSVTGYQYTVKPLIDAKPSEKLLALMDAAAFGNVTKIAA